MDSACAANQAAEQNYRGSPRQPHMPHVSALSFSVFEGLWSQGRTRTNAHRRDVVGVLRLRSGRE